ncbi:MAG TPA: hypothetical protein VHZ73_09245 [Vicinamibacterales bacterium]|nr:hypothetical protein [Vicinamibacterales bacterium]
MGGRTLRAIADRRSPLALCAALLVLFACRVAAQPERRAAVDTFNAANKAYSEERYDVAAPMYEQVIAALPDQPIAFLYLGNCYDHLASRAARGSQQLHDLLKKSEAAYQTGATKLLAMNNAGATKNAITILEMQAALYTPDRLEDPAAARAVMQQLIGLVPADPAYQFSLAKLEENAEQYDAAEAALVKALALSPTAQTYADASAHYWDIAAHGSRMTPVRETMYLEKAMAAADRSLAIDAANADAMADKSQIIREEAGLEKDKKKKETLIKDADSWAARAKAARK